MFSKTVYRYVSYFSLQTQQEWYYLTDDYNSSILNINGFYNFADFRSIFHGDGNTMGRIMSLLKF
jgi:hypothetical protein